jgi:hypothetical protein
MKNMVFAFLVLLVAVVCFWEDSIIRAETPSSKLQEQGTLKDQRDGKVYKTVQIGKQTWMATNLAYKANSGYCAYNNDQRYVATYGYLYDWKTAKVVCPAGWHLPTDAEWTAMTDELKNPNTRRFPGIPAGIRFPDGTFDLIDTNGYYWSSTEHNTDFAWYRVMLRGHIVRESIDKKAAFSVRCAEDE